MLWLRRAAVVATALACAAGVAAVVRMRAVDLRADVPREPDAARRAVHEELRRRAAARAGPVDVLLVGDSHVAGWDTPSAGGGGRDGPWLRRLGGRTVINLGVRLDRTQDVLWRLADGAADGIEPRSVVLHAGTNNVFDVPRIGPQAVAEGIRACAADLRRRFPDADLVVVKLLPGFGRGHRFLDDARAANAALDALRIDADPRVRLLDPWSDLTDGGGDLRRDLFLPDGLHLSDAGYDALAVRLAAMLGGRAR